jgi:glycosyl transferase family 25
MKAYLINLESAATRREKATKSLQDAGFTVELVKAINGKLIDPKTAPYNEKAYKLAHGKTTNLGEIGCYLSHLKAIQTFLENNEPYALIAEDDAKAHLETHKVVEEALSLKNNIDILRLSSVHRGTPLKIRKLSHGFKLTACLTRQTGAGAYVVSRKAAQKLIDKLLPMFLPYDHALDREWFYGMNSAFITPSPINQHTDTDTQIKATSNYKLPFLKRYISVFPFRAYNEITRFFCRISSLIKLRWF